MNKYLLEIGTEELPYKFVNSGIVQLKNSFEKLLNENQIKFSGIKYFSTPRRLTLIIEGFEEKQHDTVKTVKGPILSIAYDENGNLSKAGQGFAKKNGVDESALYKEDNYVWAKVEQKGKEIKDILQENVEKIVLKMQGPYFMRWADLDVKFQRPIRWVVSLLNNEELKLKIADVESSRYSRGHRFKSDNVEIKNPDSYEQTLFDNNVIVDSKKRKERIVESAKAEAEKIGADVYFDDDLLEEVTNICEWPVPVICGFDEKYLSIPEKVTVTVMAVHQRYFPLYNRKDGKLLNRFITITNYIGNNFDNIKAGNERVVVARLDDAIFFFNEDTKVPFESYVEKLKGITFQKGMGSVYDKTQRIIKLSEYIAQRTNAPLETVKRTALLCKADLVTSLVFEFTELQGFIGSDYAFNAGEKPEVVKGIKEHYYPLGADSELAEGIEGQIVGIADKIDTIVAVFAEGKKPTGSADPLGVRRATLGIIKTVIQKSLDIDLLELIKKSIDLMPVEIKDKQALYDDVKNFFEQRLNIYYTEKYRHDVVDACIANGNALANLKDFADRVEFLSEKIKTSEFVKLNEAANRIIRIAKDYKAEQLPDQTLFNNQSETLLWECTSVIDIDKLNYKEIYEELSKTVKAIDEFFENVLVMDKDEQVKQNRLALLYSIRQKFDKIADFSKFVI